MRYIYTMKNLYLLIVLFCITPFMLKAQLTRASADSIKKETVLINNVFAADTIKMHVSVMACFGGEEYDVLITKTNGHYKFWTTEGHGQKEQTKSGDLAKEGLLSIKHLFIKGLSIDNSSLCTTNEHFTATAHGQQAVFADYRCNADDYLDKIKHELGQK